MDVEDPVFSAESGDGDYYRHNYEGGDASLPYIQSSSSSSNTTSSSSSTSSSKEEDPKECSDARWFLNHLAFNPCISDYELANLVSAPSIMKRRACHGKEVTTTTTLPQMVTTKGKYSVNDEDRRRSALRISNEDAYVDVMIENYVYVSYFCNRHTGDKFRLSLCESAKNMLPYGVMYSKNKFTKVTLKYRGGPSHYFFGSGVMVESGTPNDWIAFVCHYNSMCILRDACHYPSIAVKKRKCQNIVAKGTLPFGICLVLLKHKYPNYVQYNSEDFAGAIIRLNKIDADLRDTRSTRHRHDRRQRHIDEDGDDANEDEGNELNEDGYEYDYIATQSASSSLHSTSCATPTSTHTTTTCSSNSSDETGSSSSSYEYYHEEGKREEKTCHEAFDYHVLVDKETRKNNEAALQKKQNESEYRVLEKKTLRQKDLLQIHNPDELDDYQVEALTQKKNVTILAFPKGRIICAGCKSPKEVYKAYIKVLDMLASCEDNEANKAAEANIIDQMLY